MSQHPPMSQPPGPHATPGVPDVPPRLPPGVATGVGSLPGTDVRDAARLVLGELPDFPHVPELPARGPGADMVGRAAALLVDLHVDLQPAGWRLVERPGRDERRAMGWWSQDLDAVEEFAAGYGGVLKTQLTGPGTLAAGLELPRGDKALGDPGARRDIAESLAEAVAQHVGDLRRRVPGAVPVVQLDEPGLPAVLAGQVRSASGFRVLAALEPVEAVSALRVVIDAARGAGALTVVHCCAADVPVQVVRRAGADAVSFDAAVLAGGRLDEELGEWLEAGGVALTGLVPSVGAGDDALSDPAGTVAPVRALRRRLGLDADVLRAGVVVTPACGLAGATPAYARAALAHCRDAARVLADDPEG